MPVAHVRCVQGQDGRHCSRQAGVRRPGEDVQPAIRRRLAHPRNVHYCHAEAAHARRHAGRGGQAEAATIRAEVTAPTARGPAPAPRGMRRGHGSGRKLPELSATATAQDHLAAPALLSVAMLSSTTGLARTSPAARRRGPPLRRPLWSRCWAGGLSGVRRLCLLRLLPRLVRLVGYRQDQVNEV